ncbi:MAG: hypothetical protein II720_00385, partial [Bacteroidales bacterium]|nr:hypothetical protein [Bacteroidales bacterium]
GSARTCRDGMCFGGAWEGTSGRNGVTHFHGMCPAGAGTTPGGWLKRGRPGRGRDRADGIQAGVG